MTPKDYVYLSLIALSAIVFYWTGFYGGFSSTLRILRKEEEGVGSPTLGDLSLGASSTPNVLIPMTGEAQSAAPAPGTRGTKPAEALPAKMGNQAQVQSVYFGRN